MPAPDAAEHPEEAVLERPEAWDRDIEEIDPLNGGSGLFIPVVGVVPAALSVIQPATLSDDLTTWLKTVDEYVVEGASVRAGPGPDDPWIELVGDAARLREEAHESCRVLSEAATALAPRFW
jgi:hypothetical protein